MRERDLECGVLIVELLVDELHFHCTGLGVDQKLGLGNLNEKNDGDLHFKIPNRRTLLFPQMSANGSATFTTHNTLLNLMNYIN